MAKNMLVRAKILRINTRFHAGIDVQPVTPCSFSPKIIYVSKRLEWRFPLCPINLSSLLFMVPCNQQGNQVRICNKSFGEIHYHVA